MTSIEQLAISGVRSFNPDTSARQIIRFHKPVTIILGANGCGKTTIIESLRNACTGELPVNTGKGAAFVHDPKVAGETEVKAQVRLQFRTSVGQQMLVGRSYQLTQLGGSKQKFETLDVSLQTRDPKTGQVVAQSYKCSDIDKLVPDLLGISKPILDSVIFLHQDDTNWPLSEPAKLKKKFDEIFSSTRYTKALEELRRIGKENKEKIKEHTANLAVFKEKRQAAHQLRAQAEDTQRRIQTITELIRGADSKVEAVQKQINETGAQAEEIQQLEADTIKLQGQVEALVHQRETLGQALQTVSTESDEALAHLVREFDAVFAAMKAKAEEVDRELQQLDARGRGDDEAIMRLRSQRDFLAKQRHEHEGRVGRMHDLVRAAAAEHDIPPPPGSGDGASPHAVSEQALLEFFEVFQQKVEDLKGRRDEVRAQARWAQSDVERQMSGVRQQRDGILADLRSLDAQTEQSRPQMRDLKDRYNALSGADAARAAAEEHMGKLAAQQAAEDEGVAEVTAQLGELRTRHASLQTQFDALRADAQTRRDQEQAAHKLRLLREQREQLHAQEAELTSQLTDRFKKLTGRELRGNIQEDLRQAIADKHAAVEKARRRVADVDKTVEVARQRLDELQTRQTGLDGLIQTKSATYARLVERHRRPLPELLSKAEAKEQKERKLLAELHALNTCHRRFTEQAEEDASCPLCTRGMTEAELSVMMKGMRQKLKDVPAAMEAQKKAVDSTEQLVRDARTLLPVHKEVERLGEEVAALGLQRTELKDKHDTQAEDLQTLTNKLTALQLEAETMRDLERCAARIRELRERGAAIDETIQGEEVKIVAQYGQGVRPLDLVEKEMDTLRAQMRAVEAQQQETMGTLERRRKEATVLGEQARQQARVVEQRVAEVEERERSRVAYERVHAQYTKSVADAAEAKERLPPAEQKLAQLERDLRTQREEGDKKEAAITRSVEAQQNSLSKIAALISDVKRHLEENSTQHAEELATRLAALQAEQDARQQRKETLHAALRENAKKTSKQDEMRRELAANLEYRKKCEEVKKGEGELAALRAVIRERTKGHEAVWSSLDALKEEKAAVEKERAMYAGQLQMTDALLKERQQELQGTKYDRIDERYNSTLIRLVTAQLTEEDVAKYATALDGALMKYHDEKIAEVNEIIRDLWIRTYRGCDIDHIELRSDVDVSAATRTRNYNYRVVMVKGGVSLDMRGRCSAGQKVLASLVVRLALSQAFCCDCGILALDEPTTNLDVENIDSLAFALTEIIQARRGQSNFQLIIITHDEQFVRRIGHECGTDSVYYVSKSAEGQYSTITERDFAQLM